MKNTTMRALAIAITLAVAPVAFAEDCQQAWAQCGGGEDFNGSTCCVAGYECVYESEWWSQCEPIKYEMTDDMQVAWGQCGGKEYSGPTDCVPGFACAEQDEWYSQCQPLTADMLADDTVEEVSMRQIVNFTYMDRCDNYGLSGCESHVPLDANVEAHGITFPMPYPGMVAVQGEWYFRDSVTYERDPEMLKISIRFGHDPLNATRRHVIMMKTDGSEYLQYDEVTVEDDIDGTVSTQMINCVTEEPALGTTSEEIFTSLAAQMNTTSSTASDAAVGTVAAEEEGAAAAATEGRRRLRQRAAATEARFHAHVRRHLPGFAMINLVASKQHPAAGRRLEETDATDDEDDMEIEFGHTVGSTTAGVLEVPDAADDTDLVAGGDVTAAALLGSETQEVVGSTSGDAAATDGGAAMAFQVQPEDDESGEAEQHEVAKGLFSAPDFDQTDEPLVWPDTTASCATEIPAGFEEPVTARGDLQVLLDNLENEDYEDAPLADVDELLAGTDATDTDADADEDESVLRRLRALLSPRTSSGAPTSAPRRLRGERALSTTSSTATKLTTTGCVKEYGESYSAFRKCVGVGARDILVSQFKAAAKEKLDEFKEAVSLEGITATVTAAAKEAVNAQIESMATTVLESELPATSCCAGAAEELGSAIDHIDNVVLGPMQKVSATGSQVLGEFEKPVTLQDDLTSARDTLKTANLVLKILSKFPGLVGKVFATAGKTSAQIVSKLSKAVDKLKSFNRKTASIRNKLGDFLDKNAEAAETIQSAVSTSELVGKSLFFFEEACETGVGCGACSVMTTGLTPFNDAVSYVAGTTEDVGSILNDLGKELQSVTAFMDSAAWGTLKSVVGSLGAALDPFQKLLDRKISIKLPAVRMVTKTHKLRVKVPNGVRRVWHRVKKQVKKCFRVFRKKRCVRVNINLRVAVYVPRFKTITKTVRVRLPQPYLKTFSTTVNKLISGALSVADAVMWPMNKALDAILSQLPLPDMTLPSPDFPLPSLDAFDRLDALMDDLEFPEELNPVASCGMSLTDVSDVLTDVSYHDTTTLKAAYPDLWNDACPAKTVLEAVDTFAANVDGGMCVNNLWDSFFQG